MTSFYLPIRRLKETHLCQVLNRIGKRRAEHQRLPRVFRWHITLEHELADLRFESHVQHAIRLVEDQVFSLGQRHHAAIDEILQPALYTKTRRQSHCPYGNKK